MSTRRITNPYLSKEFLLNELEQSWLNYSWWNEEGDQKYDVLVEDFDDIRDDGRTYRVMTYSHIPLADKPNNMLKPDRGRNHIRCNFSPFIHYRDGLIVLKSHHSSFNTFSLNGQISRGLTKAYEQLTTQIAKSGNWAGYSWIEDFKCQALVDLCDHGLRYNITSVTANPFAYLTTIVQNSFKGSIKREKNALKVKELLAA